MWSWMLVIFKYHAETHNAIKQSTVWGETDGLEQDFSNSIVNALEWSQFYAQTTVKPLV